MIITGIQNGANTHHQDHEIVLVNFSTRNTKNRRVEKLIPPAPAFELELLLALITAHSPQ